ncbi:hypothetical protein FACS1894132_00120 [Clostridia bacterium]|nr:hypothetical protein FACS1894132_00120 [Clostridia bacterium]
MGLGEKMSYVLGLIDGLEIDKTTKEGRVLIQMSEVLRLVCKEVEELSSKVDDVAELAEDIDYDLGELEETVFDLIDDDCCGHSHSKDDDDDEDIDDFISRVFENADDEDNKEVEDRIFYEIECPKCKHEITLEEKEIEKGSIHCPKCNELLEFDIEEE